MPPHLLDPKAMIDIVPILRGYPGAFHRLNVVAWLADPKMRDQLEEVLSHHVTACGYTEDSILTAHGLIQLNLLSTELFQFDGAFAPDADKILDVRTHPLPRTCQDRPKLITTLADILLHYDSNCAYQEMGQPMVQWNRTQKEFAHLQRILRSVLRLRGKAGFATHPDLKNIHRPTLEKACATIAKVVNALTPENFKFLCQLDLNLLAKQDFSIEYNPTTGTTFSLATFHHHWLPAMYDAFKHYGPLSRLYPQQAVNHAVAAICLQFALEDGDRPTVATRLQQRWQRHKTESAKREAEAAPRQAARFLRHRQRREADAAKFEAEQAPRSTA